MTKAIYFDMDGTIADLYGVENWLRSLERRETKPYREAKALVNMRQLGVLLNQLQQIGYHIGIVSWLAKNSSNDYDAKVTATKIAWLKKHLSAVQWDEIKILSYGTSKAENVDFPAGILFDDEQKNRETWTGTAYDVDNILEILNKIKGA